MFVTDGVPLEFPVELWGGRAMLKCWLILEKGSELRSKTRQDPSHFPDVPGLFEIHGVRVGPGRASL